MSDNPRAQPDPARAESGFFRPPIPNRFDVYVHVDFTMNQTADPRLGEILSAVQRIEERTIKMDKTLDDLLNLVTAETTALGSVKTLIEQLRDLVLGYLAGTMTPENQTKINQAFDTALVNAQAIAEALAAGVIPPAGEPPPAAAKR